MKAAISRKDENWHKGSNILNVETDGFDSLDMMILDFMGHKWGESANSALYIPLFGKAPGFYSCRFSYLHHSKRNR